MKFHLPQNISWHELRLNSKLILCVISWFHGNAFPMETLNRLTKKGGNIGIIGPSTAKSATSSPTSTLLQPAKVPSYSTALQPDCGPGIMVTELKSVFKRSHKRFRKSPRPHNWLENQFLSMKRRDNDLVHSKMSSMLLFSGIYWKLFIYRRVKTFRNFLHFVYI